MLRHPPVRCYTGAAEIAAPATNVAQAEVAAPATNVARPAPEARHISQCYVCGEPSYSTTPPHRKAVKDGKGWDTWMQSN